MEGLVSFLIFFLIFASFYSLSALGLNLQWGAAGLFNVGIVGFFAIGAYTSAIISGPHYPDTIIGGFGLWFPLGFVSAVLVTGLAALVVGYITLRLREDFLAISTFGIAISIQLTSLNWDSLTRGPNGMYGLPRPLSGYFESPVSDNALYLVLCLAITGVVYWMFERMARSPWGRALRAIREDETAAAALGKNVFALRLQAFVLGSSVFGLAGALYAHFLGFISPIDFLPIFTFQVFVMLIVGGSGNNLGALLGGLLVWGLWSASDALIAGVLPSSLQAPAAAARVVIIGLALVLMLLFRPSGILPERRFVSRAARMSDTD